MRRAVMSLRLCDLSWKDYICDMTGLCRFIILFAVLLSVSGVATAREVVTVAFYNVENLYDTVPHPSGRDADYTPEGKMRWDSMRYAGKLANVARVLDGMDADLVGLAEVESEIAVRDLVMTLHTDYNYVHLPGSDYRGMGLALLFKGDKFVPDEARLIRAGSSREVLYVRGELYGERIDLLACHLPSRMNGVRLRDKALASVYRLAESIHGSDGDARVVLAGDFNADPSERLMRRRFYTGEVAVDGDRPLFAPFAVLAVHGVGSYVYNNRWLLFDNIFLSTRFLGGDGFRYLDCGIFLRPWMLDGKTVSRKGYPLRTFAGGVYLGGYSDHLPVFVSLVRD